LNVSQLSVFVVGGIKNKPVALEEILAAENSQPTNAALLVTIWAICQ